MVRSLNGRSSEKNVISMVDIAMKDRGMTNYTIEISSIEKECSSSEFTCVFVYVALLPKQ